MLFRQDLCCALNLVLFNVIHDCFQKCPGRNREGIGGIVDHTDIALIYVSSSKNTTKKT